MEKKKNLICGTIPVIELQERLFIRVGEDTYVTLRPISKGVETKSQAEKAIKEFESKFELPARLVTEDEWDKVLEYCKINFCLREFIGLNNLSNYAVVNATNNTEEGVLFRGGPGRLISDRITPSWAGYEIKSPKVVFATITLIE
ncbi:MAG: hypothetical protein IKT41_04695 [Clostridia bacterium]|nr:hypothetical protein [Clostridia bacterium]